MGKTEDNSYFCMESILLLKFRDKKILAIVSECRFAVHVPYVLLLILDGID